MTGLPKLSSKRMRAGVQAKAKSVQKYLTATDFRRNTSSFIAGGVLALIILRAFPSTETLILKSLATSNPQAAAAANKLTLYFIGETVLFLLIPATVYGVYKNWEKARTMFWTGINILLLPSVAYLHLSQNNYLLYGWKLPYPEIALGILAVKAGQVAWKEVKTRYD